MVFVWTLGDIVFVAIVILIVLFALFVKIINWLGKEKGEHHGRDS